VFRIVVAGAIVKNKFVLLLQRRNDEEVLPGFWELPGGKRRFDETSIEALIREVKEETNLSIVMEHPISVFDYVVTTHTEIRDTTQINYYLAHPVDCKEQVRFDKKEHQKAKWFTKEELISLKEISEETRRVALSALEKP
jgi:8-oxo-dGTP pyrophosphatase MutT (NUDIX family)